MLRILSQIVFFLFLLFKECMYEEMSRLTFKGTCLLSFGACDCGCEYETQKLCIEQQQQQRSGGEYFFCCRCFVHIYVWIAQDAYYTVVVRLRRLLSIENCLGLRNLRITAISLPYTTAAVAVAWACLK